MLIKLKKTSKTSQNSLKIDENEIDISKGRYISPEKRQPVIDEVRLL